MTEPDDSAAEAPAGIVPFALLSQIEDRYWRPIESVTTLEALVADESFFADPGRHVGLFSDHGVVHVRDVSARAHELAHRVNGVLFDHRPEQRVAFVAQCAFLLAALHDIGMTPVNRFGRIVHAQFAAQVACSPDFDDIADALWADPVSPVRSRIDAVNRSSPLAAPPSVVFREVLAMAVSHSKSAVPARLLDDRAELRDLMRRAVFVPLEALASRTVADDPRSVGVEDTARLYRERGLDPWDAAFAWLDDPRVDVAEFATDVIDAIRTVRAADALRQRGTSLRTSSGFEIFADREDGRAVFALRSSDRRRLVLIRDGNPFSGSEANIREAYLTDAGALRISLHREEFRSTDRSERIAEDLADLVLDIEADVLGSFPRSADRPSGAGRIELVRTRPAGRLVDLVAERVGSKAPEVAARLTVVDEPVARLLPDLHDWSRLGEPFAPSADELAEIFSQLSVHGMNTDRIDPVAAMEGVRRVRLRTGEAVLAPHTEATTVVIPLGPGLQTSSVGGYAGETAKVVPPWVPVGLTGVARGAERNGHVGAVRDVEVLAIPAEVYLQHWFRPYEVGELRAHAERWFS